MGRMGAMGMAEEVHGGNIPMQAALHWHLQSNHSPHSPYLWFLWLSELSGRPTGSNGIANTYAKGYHVQGLGISSCGGFN